MKKITAVLLLMLICFGFASCSESDPEMLVEDGSEKSQKQLVCNLLESECEDNIVYGICLFCGENIDSDTYICDTCGSTKVCYICESDLKMFDYIFCTECYDEIKDGSVIPVYDASLESVPDNSDSPDESDDKGEQVFCENCRVYLSENEKLYCNSCWYSDKCYYCGNELDDGEYVTCGKCERKEHFYCQSCGIALKDGEKDFCSDCD